jgi:hypothetical protein
MLTKLIALATVYSFSQPNDWVDEPISPHMTYWYDTFHVVAPERPDTVTSFRELR